MRYMVSGVKPCDRAFSGYWCAGRNSSHLHVLKPMNVKSKRRGRREAGKHKLVGTRMRLAWSSAIGACSYQLSAVGTGGLAFNKAQSVTVAVVHFKAHPLAGGGESRLLGTVAAALRRSRSSSSSALSAPATTLNHRPIAQTIPGRPTLTTACFPTRPRVLSTRSPEHGVATLRPRDTRRRCSQLRRPIGTISPRTGMRLVARTIRGAHTRET
jgi:hypothetical protein